MKTIEYKGVEVQYDDTCLGSWKWLKAVASGDTARVIGAIETLFCGKDEEVAEHLGGGFAEMTELVAAITAGNQQAKN